MPFVREGRWRIGNGVQIPDRTAAVLPSDAREAIGANPRRPRDAMKLSQKTCLRSAYQIFGLKRDMFLSCARCGCSRGRAALAILYCRGIYRFWPAYPAFICPFGENLRFPVDRRIWRRGRRRRLVPGGSARGSRQPTGSAVPDGRKPLRPSPLGAGAASASPGTGV